MALIQALGRNTVVAYGTQATLTFSVRFMSQNDTSNTPFTTYGTYLPTNLPTAGTITVAGTTVTLTAADIVTPTAVLKKIITTGIAGWSLGIDNYNLNTFWMESNTYGSITAPAAPTLGTATNILFYDIKYTPGVPCPAGPNLDDIYIGGRVPVTLYLESANLTTANIQLSEDAGSLDQTIGGLTYGTNLTLVAVNGSTATAYTVTQPANYARIVVTGVVANSHVEVDIAR